MLLIRKIFVIVNSVKIERVYNETTTNSEISYVQDCYRFTTFKVANRTPESHT